MRPQRHLWDTSSQERKSFGACWLRWKNEGLWSMRTLRLIENLFLNNRSWPGVGLGSSTSCTFPGWEGLQGSPEIKPFKEWLKLLSSSSKGCLFMGFFVRYLLGLARFGLSFDRQTIYCFEYVIIFYIVTFCRSVFQSIINRLIFIVKIDYIFLSMLFHIWG